MELFLQLKDQDDILHSSLECEFESEATLKQLKCKLKAVWDIDQDYQEIYFDDGNPLVGLRENSLKSYGVTHGSKLIVKHSNLSWWSQYKNYIEIAIKPGDKRMVHAREAVNLQTRLMEQGFFNVYSSFNAFRMKYHHDVAAWADDNLQLMKKAIEIQFRAQHFKRGAEDESDFSCRFEIRPIDLAGSRKNTLALVKLHGEKEETKFNVKCHHFGPSCSFPKGQFPDIKEVFCYKLLELINVGPEAQFILSNKFTGSKTSIYIATKWNERFVPISGGEEINVETLGQLLLLGKFLFLDDLHSDNCGKWKDTNEAAIVDFLPKSHTLYKDIKMALLDNQSSLYWETTQIDALEKCSEKFRLQIAKKYIHKWDLLTKIDMANEQIKREKDLMKRHEIGFKGEKNPTEELERYIEVVKENITALIDIVNDVE
ncbi:unnamed protein product [Caenorhabditis angaria]|uniref:Ubiquitin-like domain-containing protein n=1 Tax=Caenorhabditis angaria TaxID=860376 RepID=A0A9P1IK90_9PELO|nr:unnamed protein product [Caenorhabditis angaria]